MASGGFSNGYSRTYDAHSSDSEHSDAESKHKRSVLKHRNANKRTAKTMKPCLVHKNSMTSDEDSLLPNQNSVETMAISANCSSLVDSDLNISNTNNISSVTFTPTASAFTPTANANVRQGKRKYLK